MLDGVRRLVLERHARTRRHTLHLDRHLAALRSLLAPLPLLPQIMASTPSAHSQHPSAIPLRTEEPGRMRGERV